MTNDATDLATKDARYFWCEELSMWLAYTYSSDGAMVEVEIDGEGCVSFYPSSKEDMAEAVTITGAAWVEYDEVDVDETFLALVAKAENMTEAELRQLGEWHQAD